MGVSKEVIAVKWGLKDGVLIWLDSYPYKKRHQKALSLHVQAPRKSHGSKQQEGGCLQPKGELSSDTNPTGTLILDFHSSDLWEDKNLYYLSPPVCGILLKAAWAD